MFVFPCVVQWFFLCVRPNTATFPKTQMAPHSPSITVSPPLKSLHMTFRPIRSFQPPPNHRRSQATNCGSGNRCVCTTRSLSAHFRIKSNSLNWRWTCFACCSHSNAIQSTPPPRQIHWSPIFSRSQIRLARIKWWRLQMRVWESRRRSGRVRTNFFFSVPPSVSSWSTSPPLSKFLFLCWGWRRVGGGRLGRFVLLPLCHQLSTQSSNGGGWFYPRLPTRPLHQRQKIATTLHLARIAKSYKCFERRVFQCCRVFTGRHNWRITFKHTLSCRFYLLHPQASFPGDWKRRQLVLQGHSDFVSHAASTLSHVTSNFSRLFEKFVRVLILESFWF